MGVLSGSEEQINSLNRHIMEKTENPGRDETMRHVGVSESRAKQVKIVLTDNAAGLLIGKGGATIKAIQSESKAWLSIVGTGEGPVPSERVLTCASDNLNERFEACQRIVSIISSDSSTMSNTQLKYPGGDSLSGLLNSSSVLKNNSVGADRGSASGMKQLVESIVEKLGGAIQGGSMSSSAPLPPGRRLQPKVVVTVDIPQVMVGGILGKQGCIIREMQQRSGARLTFDDSFKTEKGETNRKLNITGNMDQAYKAFQFVNERVVFIEKEQQQQQQQQQRQQQQQFGGGPGPGWMQQQQQQHNNDPYQQYQQNYDNVPYQAWGQSPRY